MAVAEWSEVRALRHPSSPKALWHDESGAKPNTIVRFDPRRRNSRAGRSRRWRRRSQHGCHANSVTANSLTNQVGLVEIK